MTSCKSQKKVKYNGVMIMENKQFMFEPEFEDETIVYGPMPSTDAEKSKKDKHKVLKIAVGTVGGLTVASGIFLGSMPSVRNAVINEVENIIYDVTKIQFDFNEDFNAGGDRESLVYGPAPADESDGIGVQGFNSGEE